MFQWNFCYFFHFTSEHACDGGPVERASTLIFSMYHEFAICITDSKPNCLLENPARLLYMLK